MLSFLVLGIYTLTVLVYRLVDCRLNEVEWMDGCLWLKTYILHVEVASACDDRSTAVEKLERCQWNHGCLSANRVIGSIPRRSSRHSLYRLGGCGQAIKLGRDTIKASRHKRVLRVTMSSDLSLEKHVSVVFVSSNNKKCFIGDGLTKTRRVCVRCNIDYYYRTTTNTTTVLFSPRFDVSGNRLTL